MAVKKFDAASEVSELDAYFKMMEMETAPAWQPEPNTTIVAECIARSMRESGYGKYPVITYKKDDGEIVAVHAFHQILRDRLAELKTDIGSRQYITYLGKKVKSKMTEEEDKSQYHMYFVQNESDVLAALSAGGTATSTSEDFTF